MGISTLVRCALLAGVFVATSMSTSSAAIFQPGPEDRPAPGSGGNKPGWQAGLHPLLGNEYKVSGLNSWLPDPSSPATVKFDGIAEWVGPYVVNESVRHVVNDRGKRETWIDFEFVQEPMFFPHGPADRYPLAEDPGRPWHLNLTDLQTPKNATFPEMYMYFMEGGVPVPMGQRRPNEFNIGEHPFIDGLSVWRDMTGPIRKDDLPPGATNGLLTKFGHYFSAVHDVDRGMGVPRGVDGFHVGYRIEIPEPATCFMGLLAVVASAWMLRRERRPTRN